MLRFTADPFQALRATRHDANWPALRNCLALRRHRSEDYPMTHLAGIVRICFTTMPRRRWRGTRVFGFEEIGRWANADGKIHNAEMRVGDTELWLDGVAGIVRNGRPCGGAIRNVASIAAFGESRVLHREA
jgi:hypothetical protein